MKHMPSRLPSTTSCSFVLVLGITVNKLMSKVTTGVFSFRLRAWFNMLYARLPLTGHLVTMSSWCVMAFGGSEAYF